jgi:tRNA(Ile)-lysidine synthase
MRRYDALDLIGQTAHYFYIVRMVLEVRKFIVKENLFLPGDRALVAVSGGPDSVALLHVLHELRNEFSLHLEVAHLQHGIRGAEAEEDARFVAELAERLALPFHLKKIDLPRMRSEAGRGNLEALARKERYRFFAAVVRERNLGKVATAHTLDDQAETVLMWLLRGSGMKGLGGMEPSRHFQPEGCMADESIVVARPLLMVSKAEIVDFLNAKGIAYRVDRTNQDDRLVRNWIRLELIPKLEARSGPGFSTRLAHQAELLRCDEWVLEGIAKRELDQIRRADGLDRELFLKQPAALQRRILRLWIGGARGYLLGVNFDHVAAMLELIAEGPPQGRLALPGGLELMKEYQVLRLVKRKRKWKPAPCYSYALQIGTPLSIPESGLTVCSERMAAPLAHLPDSLSDAVFDAALLPRTLTLRNFRRGDRYRPLGMPGHRKVKDLFVEKKVPFSVRATLPLLLAGDEILWIPGLGRSETAKIGPETEEILRLRVIPRDS